MSPAHASPIPLRRTNINLYEPDVNWLIATFGPGWQTHARDQLHEWVKTLRAEEVEAAPRTLGDLANDE